MNNIFWLMIALVAGAAIPLNGAFNARLSVAITSPIHASAISFAIGTATIAAYALADSTSAAAQRAHAPHQ